MKYKYQIYTYIYTYPQMNYIVIKKKENNENRFCFDCGTKSCEMFEAWR